MRFGHTSDWQLGMTRHFLEGEAQARYSAARIDAIRALGDVVRREACEFVVVAGDVFESNMVAERTVRRALDALATVPCPVYLLPGNHDPLDAASVYRSAVFHQARPANVVVLEEPGVVRVRDGVEIVAAPWFTKRPLGDLVSDAVA
ncbi:MAG: metallophosphoesterase, partial [Actinomycetes bacterium]|nr:metallophosphoesterase [Actinomycetes bacterium]